MNKDELIYRLLKLRNEHYELGNAMDRLDDPLLQAHGRDLLGSSKVIASWVDGIEAEVR